MIKAVLDANIFVSAVLKPAGNPGRIIDMAKRDRFKLLLSPDILAEVETVFSYPRLKKLHNKTPKWIKDFLTELTDKAEITPGNVVVEAIRNDPSDNIYLSCALEGRADFIVSGDQHLKDLEVFQGIPIVSPAEFLEVMEG
jgi:hypothetical protein